MRRFLAYFGTAAVGIVASAMGSTIYPANNGFEVNDLGSGGGAYEYGTVPSWTISGNPGEAANGSGFGVTGATNGNSDGTTSTAGQAALFQGGDGTLAGTAITQSISAPAGTSSLTIYFSAEQRNCCSGNENEAIKVYLDGALELTVTPTMGGFSNYHTVTIPSVSGPHTIGFAGLAGTPSGTDSTAFLDNVSVVTPEPASLSLLALGGLGLLARRRHA